MVPRIKEAILRKNTGRLRESLVEKKKRGSKKRSMKEPSIEPSIMNAMDTGISPVGEITRRSSKGLFIPTCKLRLGISELFYLVTATIEPVHLLQVVLEGSDQMAQKCSRWSTCRPSREPESPKM